MPLSEIIMSALSIYEASLLLFRERATGREPIGGCRHSVVIGSRVDSARADNVRHAHSGMPGTVGGAGNAVSDGVKAQNGSVVGKGEGEGKGKGDLRRRGKRQSIMESRRSRAYLGTVCMHVPVPMFCICFHV